MSDLLILISFSVAMLIGSYLAGSVPLAVSLSGRKLSFVTTLGAGLLVGTALAVILPEGVNTLYASQQHSSHHQHHHTGPEVTGGGGEADAASSPKHVEEESGGSPASLENHGIIGVATTLGFVFMFLIDQIAGSHYGGGGGVAVELEGGSPGAALRPAPVQVVSITTTIGLLVHACADGIALGAAASTSQTGIEMIVFLSIMFHKAPAAFGLVTFLLHEGLDRKRVRRHLLVFALAAPVTALTTYLLLSASGQKVLQKMNATAVAMLFSAGTFLYVATVHVLPEVTGHSHGSSEAKSPGGGGFTKLEVLAFTLGTVFPILLSSSHHH